MKKDIFFFLLAAFFLSNIMFSGDSWVVFAGSNSTEKAMAVYPTSDGGYIISGTTKEYDKRKDFVLIKLRKKGIVEWQKYFPAPKEERTPTVVETTDGSYIVGGTSFSWSKSNIRIGKFWFIKVNKNGNIVWQKVFWSKWGDLFMSMDRTKDGGIIAVGETLVNSPKTGLDLIAMKIDKNGKVIWSFAYLRKGVDEVKKVKATSDGGCIVIGKAVRNKKKWGDMWIVKLDKFGKVQWQKLYGGDKEENGSDIIETLDGNYLAVGWTRTFATRERGLNAWVLKLNKKGNILWQKRYGNFYKSYLLGVDELSDSYLAVGYTPEEAVGGVFRGRLGDAITIKMDKNGKLIWHKDIGGKLTDLLYSIKSVKGGGLISCGYTDSFKEKKNSDFFIVKFNETGDVSCGRDISINGRKYEVLNTSATIYNVKFSTLKINLFSKKTNTEGKKLNFTIKNICSSN